MKKKWLLLIILISLFKLALAQSSSLLESIKRNPDEAKSMCNNFAKLNAQGISATDPEVLQNISSKKNLTLSDAEIFTIYVIGMNCPDIK